MIYLATLENSGAHLSVEIIDTTVMLSHVDQIGRFVLPRREMLPKR